MFVRVLPLRLPPARLTRTRRPISTAIRMKTTIELPDPLFRQAKIFAARRGTTLRELVVEGLQHVTTAGSAPADATPRLTPEESAVAAIGAHGLPVLKRSSKTKSKKITRALVDRLRDELSL